MSLWPDWLTNGLPTYHGGKDKALARKMIDGMGGPSGFKTSQRTDADGTTTTVQLKGSMAPQVTVVRRIAEVIRAGLQFHGRILDGVVQLISPYAKTSHYSANFSHTHYFKEDAPTTVMPDEVPEPGQTFQPDVVLFGRDQYFSPVSTQKLEEDNWVYADSLGRRWQLSAEVVHGDDTTRVIIRNRGLWVFGGATTVSPGTIIADETFAFSMATFQNKAKRPQSPSYDWANPWGVFGAVFGVGATVHNKPNGSQAMIHRYDCVADSTLWPQLWAGQDSYYEYKYDANLSPPYVLNLRNYYALNQVFKVDVVEGSPNPTATITMYKDQGNCYALVTHDQSATQSSSFNYSFGPGFETWTPVNTAVAATPTPMTASYSSSRNISETALFAVMYTKAGALAEITGDHTQYSHDLETASGGVTFANSTDAHVDSGWWRDLSGSGGSSHEIIYVDLTHHIPSGSNVTEVDQRYSDYTNMYVNGAAVWQGFYYLQKNITQTVTMAGFSEALNPPGGQIFGSETTYLPTSVAVGTASSVTTSAFDYKDSFVGRDYSGPTEVRGIPVGGPDRDIYMRPHWRSNNVLEVSHAYYELGSGYFSAHPDTPTSPYDAEFPTPVLITPSGGSPAPYDGYMKSHASWNPRSGAVLRGSDRDGWV